MDEPEKIGAKRRSDGTFGPGNNANPEGRPIETEEQKLVRKAKREFVKEYKEKLEESLPYISPVLIAKAIGGDIQAIKEIHDIVVGKMPTKIAGDPDKPLIIQISQEIAEKNEIETEKL